MPAREHHLSIFSRELQQTDKLELGQNPGMKEAENSRNYDDTDLETDHSKDPLLPPPGIQVMVLPLNLAWKEMERQYIERVYKENKKNIKQTARSLKISPRTLQRKLDSWGGR